MLNFNSPILISPMNANDFFQLVEETLNNMTRTQREEVYLLDYSRHAIVISYDRSLYPFLGFSAGYNHEPDRVYFDRDSYLTLTIAIALNQKFPGMGGRVFVGSDGAYRIPHTTPIYLCWWHWEGRSLFETVSDILEISQRRW